MANKVEMSDEDLIYKININPEKINGKNIFISGGTGSFGKKMIKTLLTNFKPNRIIIYSRDEYKQSLLKVMFDPNVHKCLRFFLGDIRDYARLKLALKHVDIIFHTAALKRIQECEYNPMEAVNTNVLGTNNIVQAAIENNVKYVLALSTDKACAPVNLYGGTKLVGEKIVVNGNILSGGATKFAVVRYGNQLNSRGSLVEIFGRLKEEGKELTVTDAKMTRFTILLQEAVNFVLQCMDRMAGGEIFIPKLPSYTVEQMLEVFDAADNWRSIGVRAGEKHHELMINADESHMAWEFDDFFIIVPAEELMLFNFNNYNGLKRIRRKESQPYSSGDNELITNERLRRLIQTELC